jgi:AraC family transcriptional regulator, L-rhamnose operon regulatory protein RhaS
LLPRAFPDIGGVRMSQRTARSSLRWERHDSPLPEIQHLSWAEVGKAMPSGYERQINADAYQIDYAIRGNAEWWIGDEIFEIGAGDILLSKPGEPHGCVDSVYHSGKYCCLIFRFPADDVMPGLSRADSKALRRGFAQAQRRRFAAPACAEECFAAMFAEFRQPRDLSVALARAAFHRLIATIVRQEIDVPAQPVKVISPPISKAVAWIDKHLGEIARVEDIARAVGIRSRQFHDRFRREIGMTPNSYLMQRRVRRAKQLLRQGSESVLNIALELGFSSSQYFAMAFKQLSGLTPIAYRRLAGRHADL